MPLEYPFELPITLFQSIDMPLDTRIDDETLAQFGRALMVVAGADGVLSVWERGWLTAYLAAYHAPPGVVDGLEAFDYRSAELLPLLKPLLAGPYARWVRRSILQGAIRMASADGISPAEQAAIEMLGARLGMPTEVVAEVSSLVAIFDSVASTNAVLLSIAQKEDAEEILRRRGELPTPDAWDDANEDSLVTLPEDEALERGQATFARALLYVAGADGEITDAEMSYFQAYMRNWGASTETLALLKDFDYANATPESIIEGAFSLNWGLKALTTVAIRTAGADGLSTKEEEALLELYRLSEHDVLLYYANKGLEDVRSMALKRLNAIFAAYN